ncbi:MAG: hypothetical protein Q9227_002761 [Pyrenula ochraceoflavens]
MAIPIPPQHGGMPPQQPRPTFPPQMGGGIGGMGPGPAHGPGMGGPPPHQAGPGGPDFLNRFGGLNLGGGQMPKPGPPKEAPKPPAGLKPGAVVAYEGYTFDRIDGWEVASKRSIRVSQDDFEKKATKKNANDIIDQMRRMSAARRAQVDRLIEEKMHDEKEPWFEWSPVAVEDGRHRIARKGNKDVKEVLAMDVFIVKKAKKDLPIAKEEKKDVKKPQPRYNGTVVDVRQPLKGKEAGQGEPKKQEPLPGFPGGGGGIFGRPMGPPGQHGVQGPHIPHGPHIPQGPQGQPGGPLPQGGMPGHPRPGPFGGAFGPGFGGGGHGFGAGGPGPQPQPGGGRPRDSNPIKIFGDDEPFGDDIHILGDDKPKKNKGDPFAASYDMPKGPKKKKSFPKIIPEDDSQFSDDEDVISVFDEDLPSSATSMYSNDFEKHVPSRGSLKSPRRRSKGPDGPVYREHKREKSYPMEPPPRDRRGSRYGGEAYDLYTERAKRPGLGRRSTVAYPSGPRRLTNGDSSPPLSPLRPHSPPRRSSGLPYPDEYERMKRERERSVEDYLREKVLQEREDDLRRRQLNLLDLEREKQLRDDRERLNILDRMTWKSDPMERLGLGGRRY